MINIPDTITDLLYDDRDIFIKEFSREVWNIFESRPNLGYYV
jgi:hypothetical protein